MATRVDYTCPSIDAGLRELRDIEHLVDNLKERFEELRQANDQLRTNWTEADREVDNLQTALDAAETKITDLEVEIMQLKETPVD